MRSSLARSLLFPQSETAVSNRIHAEAARKNPQEEASGEPERLDAFTATTENFTRSWDLTIESEMRRDEIESGLPNGQHVLCGRDRIRAQLDVAQTPTTYLAEDLVSGRN